MIDKRKFKIIGAGPAGTTLGSLLRKSNYDVTIYDIGERPELIVGESLLPSMMTYIKDLGLLDEVEKIGVKKLGSTIYLSGTEPWLVEFSKALTDHERFAYNVPRKEFDKLFLEKALSLGCKIVNSKVLIKSDILKDTVWIDEFDENDFILDASGRNRVVAKALNLKTLKGNRNDIALFSHLDKALIPYEGNIHIDVFKYGWSWRIPLKNKVSVGIVAPSSYFNKFGEIKEVQYDNVLKESFISQSVLGSRRQASVMKYSNYQLRSERFYGKNWALVGDSGGFLDPVFSSGMYLSIKGASLLANFLISGEDLINFEKNQISALDSWSKLIDSFYDGRFFSMIHVGNNIKRKSIEIFEKHEIGKIFSTIMAGYGMENEEIRSKYEFILDFCSQIHSSIQIGQNLNVSNFEVQR
jgi:flavin-dependent dehydrogenase